jgi:hypothetical protein
MVAKSRRRIRQCTSAALAGVGSQVLGGCGLLAVVGADQQRLQTGGGPGRPASARAQHVEAAAGGRHRHRQRRKCVLPSWPDARTACGTALSVCHPRATRSNTPAKLTARAFLESLGVGIPPFFWGGGGLSLQWMQLVGCSPQPSPPNSVNLRVFDPAFIHSASEFLAKGRHRTASGTSADETGKNCAELPNVV